MRQTRRLQFLADISRLVARLASKLLSIGQSLHSSRAPRSKAGIAPLAQSSAITATRAMQIRTLAFVQRRFNNIH
jgi:hypothetical protein